VAGTLVVTADGLKKIEEIQVGDKVWSFNEQTGEIELKEVVSLSQNTAKVLIEITIGYEKIVCTPEHPFFVANNWVEAKDLNAGDKLTLKDGSYVVISTIKQLEKTEKVYNFEVAENHNYYVSG
jgi:intein/homing endonuclease